MPSNAASRRRIRAFVPTAMLASTMLFQGCAAMISGSNATLRLNSANEDTVFYIDDRIVGRGTEARTELPKKGIRKAVLLGRAHGCEDVSTAIDTTFDPVTLAGLVVDLGLISILVVDGILTGATTKARIDTYDLTPNCPRTDVPTDRLSHEAHPLDGDLHAR